MVTNAGVVREVIRGVSIVMSVLSVLGARLQRASKLVLGSEEVPQPSGRSTSATSSRGCFRYFRRPPLAMFED